MGGINSKAFALYVANPGFIPGQPSPSKIKMDGYKFTKSWRDGTGFKCLPCIQLTLVPALSLGTQSTLQLHQG